MKAITSAFLVNFLPLLLCLAGYIGYNEYRREPAAPSAAVDGAKLGKLYAPEVLAGLADGWDAAADKLDAGATIADAQTTLQSTWAGKRQAAFAQLVQPQFARILTEGAEPTAAQRPLVAHAWRDFAAGLRLKGGAR